MKNRKGYTLVEIAIVMLIISIMSIIVKGTYDGTVEKSKWSEPYTVVNKIIDAQKQFYVLNDKFAKDIEELNLNIDGDKESNGTAILTKYFRYNTNSSDDNSICKISVDRVLNSQKAGVTFVFSYFDKDTDEHPGNTFYITTDGEINADSFPSKPAVRELTKFANFFANKSY